jgi:geranylgeranyl pyrophosphate synthase
MQKTNVVAMALGQMEMLYREKIELIKRAGREIEKTLKQEIPSAYVWMDAHPGDYRGSGGGDEMRPTLAVTLSAAIRRKGDQKNAEREYSRVINLWSCGSLDMVTLIRIKTIYHRVMTKIETSMEMKQQLWLRAVLSTDLRKAEDFLPKQYPLAMNSPLPMTRLDD